jgi:peroxiredoxin
MLLLSRLRILVISAIFAVVCTACQPKAAEKRSEPSPPKTPITTTTDDEPSEQPAPQPASKPAASKPAPKAETKPAAVKPKLQAPPPPPTIPKVALSDALRATCLVSVGDTMPTGELPDPAGKMHALDSLYGEKLTVVCFWTIGTSHRSQLVAAAELQDLMKKVAEPFGKKGVHVVGINVGDAPAAVGQEVGKAAVTFPNLLDPKGEFLAKVAKDKKMPRTFLLDASGRILWFDVEYSRPSRRDLAQSIRVVLGEL